MTANKDPANHRIRREHPALPGHFPNYPIVPGVVILNELLNALADRYPSQQLCGIKKLKFLHPLRPEQDFTIGFADIKNNGLRFKCWITSGDVSTDTTEVKTLMAEGNLKLKPTRV